MLELFVRGSFSRALQNSRIVHEVEREKICTAFLQESLNSDDHLATPIRHFIEISG